MDRFWIISENRIQEAQKNGEFDNLPGKGKPLPPDELAGLPESMRVAYKLMKNAGYTEEDMDLKKEMMTIEDLIRKTDDGPAKEQLKKELNSKMLQYNSMISKRGIKTNSSLFKNYESKIEKKFFPPENK